MGMHQCCEVEEMGQVYAIAKAINPGVMTMTQDNGDVVCVLMGKTCIIRLTDIMSNDWASVAGDLTDFVESTGEQAGNITV